GGVTSTVNFALSIIPVDFAVTGLFLMGCFISLAMGTSCGTIAALAPIAVDISAKTGYNPAMCIGAVVCGAMFGDNLSMISDTTIAAVRTQGCEMSDKFKANFKIVLPAALVTVGIFYAISSGNAYVANTDLKYNVIQIVPYMLILVGALFGVNVFTLLGGGTIVSVLVGLYTNSFNAGNILGLTGKGLSGMYEISIIAILAACISALVRMNGGFKWILDSVQVRVGGYKGGQFGIGALVLMMDFATANNTIAIVLAAPLAKQIAKTFKISAKRSASLLDIFSSVGQGLIPYGAQLLSAAALTGLTPLVIMPYLYYPVLMLVCVVAYILMSKEGE
ncbi:MAG: Na+/H+ antiporter NhaC family protein, partial [Phascolarctobacterium sp.]|nr:Na+/H+ antiporter NhaC family protein [Phascolarctobacterium sp.]